MKYKTALVLSFAIGAAAPLIFHGLFLLAGFAKVDSSGATGTALISLTIILSPVSFLIGMTVGYGNTAFWDAISIWAIAMLLNGALYALIGSVFWRAAKKGLP